MAKVFRLLMLGLLISVGLLVKAEPVRYPAIANQQDPRSVYPLALLEQALSYAETRYQLQSSTEPMSKSRAMVFLREGQEIDVIWTMTSIERELELLPVRIPIFRGLSGYRVALIHQANQDAFAAIHAPVAIRRLLYAQGHDWVDTKILRLNGFNVMDAARYENLFSMLQRRRVDAVPRNVLEITDEAAVLAPQSIVIEQNWLIHYPAASYFFVRSDNEQLAGDIRHGLEKMLADGSFEQLFQQFFSSQLAELKLEQRQLIILENPLLPAQTPLQDHRLWYHPAK
ncbi:transporter substrate-binding domain-containing protein [Arsukibacterium sp.]|uniref:transporter substrate-binding domain-containing protein n=1 Tax=Arsukibacterium sp. TaxID=1977258 RepID=UPI001BD36685|nr:transporter substrate-binding domain-containing protein [Arsukibacterium sp.]